MPSLKAPIRNYLAMGLLVIISVAVLGEALARLLPQPVVIPSPPSEQSIDPRGANPYIVRMRPYIHFHIPGASYVQSHSDFNIHYRINAAGFRGPEIPLRQKDVKRLLIIGDSVTEGHGVAFDQTYAFHLNRMLSRRGWEAINCGVQGAGPLYHAANLPRYLACRPDAVLMGFFWNDIGDDRYLEEMYFRLPIMDDETQLIVDRRNDGGWLRNHSRIYTALKRIIGNIHDVGVEKSIRENLKRREVQTITKSVKSVMKGAEFDTHWRMSELYMDEVLKGFRRNGVHFMVADLGLAGQSAWLDKKYIRHAGRIRKRLHAWARERNVPVVLLEKRLVRRFAGLEQAEIAIQGDGHPTPMAHSVIAKELHAWIRAVLSTI